MNRLYVTALDQSKGISRTQTKNARPCWGRGDNLSGPESASLITLVFGVQRIQRAFSAAFSRGLFLGHGGGLRPNRSRSDKSHGQPASGSIMDFFIAGLGSSLAPCGPRPFGICHQLRDIYSIFVRAAIAALQRYTLALMGCDWQFTR